MAAPKGNKFNERWTEEKSIKFFEDSLTLLKAEETIVFIGSLATKMSSYRQMYSFLVDKFGKENKDFVTIKKEIDSIIESRLFEGALNNDFNSAVSIFGLKNNHNWKDKKEISQDLNLKQDISNLTTEELIKRANAIKVIDEQS